MPIPGHEMSRLHLDGILSASSPATRRVRREQCACALAIAADVERASLRSSR